MAKREIFDREYAPENIHRSLPIEKDCSRNSHEGIHREWGDRLIKELQIFTLQETYSQFKEKEKLIDANPAWHVSTPQEKLIYFQKSIIERVDKKYAPIIPKLTMLIQVINIYQQENSTEVDWDMIILPKLMDILEEYNLFRFWNIPFCFDFYDMKSWSVYVAYIVSKKKIPWYAAVKLIKRKNIHPRLTESLDEYTEDTDLLISLSAEIDLQRTSASSDSTTTKEKGKSPFCTFCSNKKAHLNINTEKKEDGQSARYFLSQASIKGTEPSHQPPIYKTVIVAGTPLAGRHSTGSDVNIVDWKICHSIATKTPSFKIKYHSSTIKGPVNINIPSTCYVEAQVMYLKKYVGIHRFYVVDTEEPVETIFGLSLILACAKIENPSENGLYK